MTATTVSQIVITRLQTTAPLPLFHERGEEIEEKIGMTKDYTEL